MIRPLLPTTIAFVRDRLRGLVERPVGVTVRARTARPSR
jgi:hypothetical protein